MQINCKWTHFLITNTKWKFSLTILHSLGVYTYSYFNYYAFFSLLTHNWRRDNLPFWLRAFLLTFSCYLLFPCPRIIGFAARRLCLPLVKLQLLKSCSKILEQLSSTSAKKFDCTVNKKLQKSFEKHFFKSRLSFKIINLMINQWKKCETVY